MTLGKTFLAVFCGIGMILPWPASLDEGRRENSTSAGALPRVAQQQVRDFKNKAAEIVGKVPDGTTLEDKDFDTAFGADTANAFRSAGLTKVSNSNNHYRVEFAQEYETDVKSIHVKFKSVVEFDYLPDSTSLVFKNIKGVEVNKYGFLRHSDLREFTLSDDSQSGSILIHAYVKVFGFIPNNVDITIGPDGKPIIK